MGTKDSPTHEQEAAMAEAALDAARAKAVELGLHPLMCMYGIAAAMEGIRRTAAIVSLIGVEGAIEIGRALRHEAECDVIQQAEDILKGDM